MPLPLDVSLLLDVSLSLSLHPFIATLVFCPFLNFHFNQVTCRCHQPPAGLQRNVHHRAAAVDEAAREGDGVRDGGLHAAAGTEPEEV